MRSFAIGFIGMVIAEDIGFVPKHNSITTWQFWATLVILIIISTVVNVLFEDEDRRKAGK